MTTLDEKTVASATRGDQEALAAALASTPALAARRTAGGETLLHIVSRQWPMLPNGADLARLLIQHEADVNAEDNDGLRPLTGATGDPDLTRVLVEAGAATGIYAANHMNMSPAEVCLYYGLAAEARLLVELGAPVDLRIAAGIGDLQLLESFVTEGATIRPDAVGLPGQPGPKLTVPEGLIQALSYAARNGQIAAARKLLDWGAEIDALVPHFDVGCTPLHQAVAGGHASMVEMLIAQGARLDVRDDAHDSTPCGWAKEQGRQDLVAIFERNH